MWMLSSRKRPAGEVGSVAELPEANVIKALLCVVVSSVQSAPGVCGIPPPPNMTTLFDSLSWSDADTGAQTRPSSSLILWELFSFYNNCVMKSQ